MSDENNGGPAFPKTGSYDYDSPSAHDSENQDGMTLRDYFAAKALPTLIKINDGGNREYAENTAELCYFYADAMIRARDKDETK